MLFQLGNHGGTGFLRIRNDILVLEIIHRFQMAFLKQIHLAGTVLPRVRRRGGGSLRRGLFRLGRSKQIVRREGGLPGFRRFFPEQLGLHGTELKLLKEGQQLFRTGVSFDQFRQGHGQGNVPVNGGQLFGKGRHGSVFLHDLPALSLQLVRIRQQVLHGAELPD